MRQSFRNLGTIVSLERKGISCTVRPIAILSRQNDSFWDMHLHCETKEQFGDIQEKS
jgi:hypothetical protein